MNKSTWTPTQNTELIIIFILLIFTFLFWESKIVFPIKLFVVLIHEISHVVAAVLSGGEIKFLTFNLNLSGQTIIKNGNAVLLAASGYLGSLMVGSMIYLTSFYPRFKKWFLNILVLIILIVTINLIQGGIQIFLGLLVSAFFFIIPRYFPEFLANIILRFIGLVSCFYVLADIKEDLLTSTLRETDTQILEYITGVSATAIGLSWFLISAAVVFLL
ncbi:MAG: M50 family metallopeptidase, partial [Ignavibacteriae bacterium]|nr:M50 family metallopeptidase [Ignavibacteriota bacterium]